MMEVWYESGPLHGPDCNVAEAIKKQFKALLKEISCLLLGLYGIREPMMFMDLDTLIDIKTH